MTNNKVSQSYKYFNQAEGNQHIASEYAIEKLQNLSESFNIKNILEVGLGIGSIAGILLKNNNQLSYTGTEANEFCLKALPKNLGNEYQDLQIYQDIDSIPGESYFDLIIVDGADGDLSILKKIISRRGIIALEGDRKPQEEFLKKLFPVNKFVHCISLQRNSYDSPFRKEEWQGGIKIIFVNPNFQQYLWWLKEKIKTKIKYQYPGRHFGNFKLIDQA